MDSSDSGSDDSNAPISGPNGEPLVSKTESQVGKYADIDGDGAVDGIIFADLMVGGSGTWNQLGTSNSTYNERGTYNSNDFIKQVKTGSYRLAKNVLLLQRI